MKLLQIVTEALQKRYGALRSVMEQLGNVAGVTKTLQKRCVSLRDVTERYGTVSEYIDFADPTHHPKQHPDPISRFATINFTDFQTDRQRLTDGPGECSVTRALHSLC